MCVCVCVCVCEEENKCVCEKGSERGKERGAGGWGERARSNFMMAVCATFKAAMESSVQFSDCRTYRLHASTCSSRLTLAVTYFKSYELLRASGAHHHIPSLLPTIEFFSYCRLSEFQPLLGFESSSPVRSLTSPTQLLPSTHRSMALLPQ